MQWRRFFFVLFWIPFYFVIFSSLQLKVTSGVPLNRFVRHYERLNYDQHDLHVRTRRAITDTTRGVQVKFTSHARTFHLNLYPDNSAFASDHIITDGKGRKVEVDISFLFDGNVRGVNDSYVHGAIKKGVFEGKIYLDNETFVVEHAKYYFKEPKNFHSVIYSENDVIFPETSHSQSGRNHSLPPHPHPHPHPHRHGEGGCGLSEKIRNWMRDVQASGEPNRIEVPLDLSLKQKTERKKGFLDGSLDEDPAEKYRRVLNEVRSKRSEGSEGSVGSERSGGLGGSVGSERSKRSADSDKHRLCNLYIQTDKFLWDAIYEREKDAQRTREEILSIISTHIKAVTRIYGNHKFGDIVGIQFAVQRTTINDSSSCSLDDRNPFCQKYLDVSNLLNYNSMVDHSGFCLAFLFTYRDFAGGTLGLAWVASANGPSGGICETYKRYTETLGGKRVQTYKSLNTGVITFVNYGNRVPPTVSHLTLAHEIGHNFGAAHDPPNTLCQPNGADGNYIMYPSATNGDRPNNDKFSPCSIENMTAVLKAVLNQLSGKRNCFVPNDLAYCGNKIVEKGEQCDCGYNVDECKEKCCYPRQLDDQWLKESAKECSLRYSPDIGRKVDCSPSQGPCCTTDCTFVAGKREGSGGVGGVGEGHQCREASECTEASFCSVDGATCPAPRPKPDISPCDNSSKVCKGGECNASICLLFGMEQCFLTDEKLPRDREGKEAMCFVACQYKDRPETCKSTREKDFPTHRIFNGTFNQGIRLRPGAPCNNFRGYCDIFHRCRSVDGDGPLRRLTTSLFSSEALESAASWITTNWWAVMLIGIALVVVMGGFIKCCAVHTPSSNPKKRPARRLADDWHSISTTLRRGRRHRSDGVHHHRDRVPRHRDPRHGRGGGRDRRSRSGQPVNEASAPPPDVVIPSSSIPLVQVHDAPPPPYSQAVAISVSEIPPPLPPLRPVPPGGVGNKVVSGGPPRGHRKHRGGGGGGGGGGGQPLQGPSSSSHSAQRNMDQIVVAPQGGRGLRAKKEQKARK